MFDLKYDVGPSHARPEWDENDDYSDMEHSDLDSHDKSQDRLAVDASKNPYPYHPASLAHRILRAALPTILDITQAPDEIGHHPCFDLPSDLGSRTAYEYFIDTLKVQLVTLNGKLEVIQGHYLGPQDIEPISPHEMRHIGFHDFDVIPKFNAAEVRFTKPYSADNSPLRSGRWFKAAAPGLEERGAICVMAQPGDDPCEFTSSLRMIACIRAARLDVDARIVPLLGELTPTYLPTHQPSSFSSLVVRTVNSVSVWYRWLQVLFFTETLLSATCSRTFPPSFPA